MPSNCAMGLRSMLASAASPCHAAWSRCARNGASRMLARKASEVAPWSCNVLQTSFPVSIAGLMDAKQTLLNCLFSLSGGVSLSLPPLGKVLHKQVPACGLKHLCRIACGRPQNCKRIGCTRFHCIRLTDSTHYGWLTRLSTSQHLQHTSKIEALFCSSSSSSSDCPCHE